MVDLICDEFSEDLKKFQDLIKSQHQLPQNMNKLVLLRFLKVCDFNQSEALDLLLFNLKLRKQNPHIFTNRDLMSEEMENISKFCLLVAVPSLTQQKTRITIFRMIDDDPEKVIFDDFFKLYTMLTDTRDITPDAAGLCEGDIIVFDFAGLTFQHVWRIIKSVKSVRLFLRFVQEAVPSRVLQGHCINCPPIFSKLLALVRPFVKKEVYDILHFHNNGYDSFHQFVSKEFLPLEYGGSAGSCDEIAQNFLSTAKSHNEYLKDGRNWELYE